MYCLFTPCKKLLSFVSTIITHGTFWFLIMVKHGGGVRCKLAGCNRVAIGKVQLCRAHGGGCRPKNTRGTFSNKKVVLPLVSSGFTEGTFCVPIIESTIDSQAYSVGTVDLANV